jgi:hypothetical protein
MLSDKELKRYQKRISKWRKRGFTRSEARRIAEAILGEIVPSK